MKAWNFDQLVVQLHTKKQKEKEELIFGCSSTLTIFSATPCVNFELWTLFIHGKKFIR